MGLLFAAMDTPNTRMLDDVLAHLDRTKGQWPTIAEKSGVPYKTLTKIAQRETLNPGVQGVQQLYDYFHGIERPAVSGGELVTQG